MMYSTRTMGSSASIRRRGSARSTTIVEGAIPGTILECPLCFEEVTESKILPCYHYFCSECVQKMSTTSDVVCKLCNERHSLLTGLRKPGVNAAVNELASCKRVLGSNCEICESKSEYVCTECKTAMCSRIGCRDKHRLRDTLKQHNVVSKERFRVLEESRLADSMTCPWHMKETVDLFCTKCDVIICRKCADYNHYHEYNRKPMTIAEGRKRMATELNEKTKELEQFTATLKDIGKMARRVKRDKVVEATRENIIRKIEIGAADRQQNNKLDMEYSVLLDELERLLEDQQNQTAILDVQCADALKAVCLLQSALHSLSKLTKDVIFLYLVKQLLVRIAFLMQKADGFVVPFEIEYIANDGRDGECSLGCLRKSWNPKCTVSPKFLLRDTYTGEEWSLVDGQLSPHGLTIQANSIVVAERLERRVRVLERKRRRCYTPVDNVKDVVQFDPVDIATISENEVAVTDFENMCFHRIDTVEWKYLGSFGKDALCGPQGIAKTNDGYLAITDCNCGTSKKECSVKIMATDGAVMQVLKGDKYNFSLPWGVAVNSANDLIVANQRSHQVQIIGEGGGLKCEFGNYGNDDGSFRGPIAVAVDQFDNVIVGSNSTVQLFSPSGRFLCRVNRHDVIDGGICGVAYRLHEQEYQIVVSDTENNQIKIYKLAM
ncbi:uncharacterized protein LOC144440327 [Glandiceps talaboti]